MRVAAVLLLALLLAPANAHADWTEADKDGFGTSATTKSKVWHTLDDGVLTEVYYPDLGTPAVRDLQLVVSGEAERDATDQRIELTDPRSLSYRQVNTATSGRYRITKDYTTDPARDALLIDVRVESLSGEKLDVDVRFDPELSTAATTTRARRPATRCSRGTRARAAR